MFPELAEILGLIFPLQEVSACMYLLATIFCNTTLIYYVISRGKATCLSSRSLMHLNQVAGALHDVKYLDKCDLT